jgi:hypothetical protein
MIAVIDEARKLVESTAKLYGSEVFFFHGHLRDIAANFSLMDTTSRWKSQKYPCIVLLQDFAVERPSAKSHKPYQARCKTQWLILADSDATYTPEQRYDKVYTPVLYPIYEAFVKSLAQSKVVVGDTSHTQIDRLRMTNSFNEAATAQGLKAALNDYLDGIEVRDLNLELRKKCT